MNPSHKETLPILEEGKNKIKESDTYKELCKEHGVDEDIIDLIPMAFSDLDVSARTENGCIYFNYKLLDNFDSNLHYMLHEFTHALQQCWGDGPTQGADDGEYLDNKFEQEGFQVQTKYLSETEGDGAAEAYTEKVMNHHDVPENDKEKRKKDLLNLASMI